MAAAHSVGASHQRRLHSQFIDPQREILLFLPGRIYTGCVLTEHMEFIEYHYITNQDVL